MPPTLSPAEQLCLSCGMCCNGVLHNFTYLQPEELIRAGKLGLDVVRPYRQQARQDPRSVFRQPCAALQDTFCQVYAQRPQACRSYTCHILERLQSGDLTIAAALEIVTQVRQLIEELRDRMPYPLGFLSLDRQVRGNWPPSRALPEEVQPLFTELAGLLRSEWKASWRRTRRRRSD